jgi:phosphatidylglycerol---prolipoprotein diacylglyceryl transferase
VYPRLYTLPAFDLFGSNWGPFTLHTYGVLLAVAFIAGLAIAGRHARRAQLDPDKITDLAVYVLIAGLIGAKLGLLVVEWDYYSRNWRELFSLLQSGGVFYGGLIAAFPVAWWYSRKYALPGWTAADALAPAVVLGQSIGRLGCFAAGCCFGKPTTVAWAVTFRDLYAARAVGTPIDTPLHPTQLYESFATFLIFLALLAIAKRKKFEGQVALSYVLFYSAARFVIEFYRGDVARGSVFGGALSTSQFLAILLALGAMALWPIAARAGRKPAAAAPANA